MSSSDPYSPPVSARKRTKQATSAHYSDDEDSRMNPRESFTAGHVASDSLHSIHVPPSAQPNGTHANGGRDEVEMSLLGDGERRAAAVGVDDDDTLFAEKKPKGMSRKDKQGMVLLIVLYLIQGVPLGLALGSIPFLLRENLSYAQLGVFTLSSYPYSLKLLWSPIVDSMYFQRVGRRKSWIVPMQIVIGTMMIWISYNVVDIVASPEGHVTELTIIFTTLVFLSATQDIAVDGWALTLLSPENVSYASTAQTIGLNTGYFASFTVFLALNSAEFAAKYGIPQLSLAAYMRFWAFICYGVTFWLLFFKKEDPVSEEDADLDLVKVYKIMWSICKLKQVQSLCIVHFLAKIAFQANEAVTSLKMVEKGLGKEDLAVAVLIDFPFQIFGGWLAAKWSIGDKPLRPWLYAYWVRIGFAIVAMLMVFGFPKPPIPTSFFLLIIVFTVTSSFAGTIQFVGISAFHTRIADPVIGGTYMTLLNTASNLGGTWPRYFVLKGVDLFSIADCHVKEEKTGLLVKAAECVSDHGKALCTQSNGQCIYERDGYYVVSTLCIIIGCSIFVAYILPTAKRLQALPVLTWRVNLR